mgnify:CR=1 FL=1|jgi:hypothetical protein|tara:strand:- start:348 stop:713 length:366 start_codon:yes stop_codon:yes gene_type:complete
MLKQAAMLITFMLFISGCVATTQEPLETTAEVCKDNMIWADWERKKGGKPGEIPHLNKKLRLIFLRNFNSTPPVSDYNPEKVYLINNGSMIMAFFVDGLCVTLVNPIPATIVRSWMSSMST